MSSSVDGLLLLGATGDLANRKLYPALFNLHRRGLLPGRLVGVGRRQLPPDGLAELATASVLAAGPEGGNTSEAELKDFANQLHYICGDYHDTNTWDQICDALGPAARSTLAFLAIPPSAFDDVIEALAAAGLAERGRVMVEKPFGRDEASARELNEILLRHYREEAVFRIDHFLGKEPVQNILVTRFANSLFEPLLNRYHVKQVRVTMAEDFGAGDRGAFYDSVGTVRDVVQNHLLQLVCLLAMDPPVTDGADALNDEVVKVLRSIRTVERTDVVRGQYRGYRDHDGVAPGSTTETFAAVTMEVDTWRWAGVPFHLVAGKAMSHTATEAVIDFRPPPQALFSGELASRSNHLRFRVKPEGSIALHLQAKQPGDRLVGQSVELEVAGPEPAADSPDAYERLIADAMEGDRRLFARQDTVTEAWRIFDPVLADPPPVHPYDQGSDGPPGTAHLLCPPSWD